MIVTSSATAASRDWRLVVLAGALLAAATAAQASSHREAPFITTAPKVDATDFYMFRSYESGRANYVTLIADYLPLQDAYGGPNYFKLDPNALYEIHIDNTGDAKEDLTFQFRFKNTLADTKIPVGDKMVSIPLTQSGAIANRADPNSNVAETFTLDVVRGDRRTGTKTAVMNGSAATFDKPVDNIGFKTIADYATYAGKHIYNVTIPGCTQTGNKVFVGQRKDPFAVNLGTIFDLVNAPAAVITNPANINAGKDDLADKNVTTLALEIHKDCLTAGTEPVIGGWTTASLRQGRLLSGKPKPGYQTTASIDVGPWVQVSRLGMPLVNEVVIGLKDKDRFNASKPQDDAQFLDYVTNPTLPPLLGLVLAGDLAALAPTNLPRTDLATTFLTGITGVNKPATVTPAEMLRLNTAIAPVPRAQQNRLGVAGEVLRVGGLANLAQARDLAGYPNGRRPNDDVVDISLVAVLGGLCVINGDSNGLGLNGVPGVPSLTSQCKISSVPLGATSAAVHDAVDQATVPLLNTFPYLATPIGGTVRP